MPNTALSPAEFEELLDSGGFSDAFASKANKRQPLDMVVEDWGPLDGQHLEAQRAHEASGATSGMAFNVTSGRLRHTHHRLAQFIASGMPMVKVAAMTGRSPQSLAHLQANPAFAELVAHYKGVVDDEFQDFTSAAAALSMDMLGALQEMLDEAPEKFGPGHLMDAIKLLADRTGHAPVTKNLNLNVNLGLGDRLRAARERADAADLQTATLLPREGE